MLYLLVRGVPGSVDPAFETETKAGTSRSGILEFDPSTLGGGVGFWRR